jgi:hypothetical protein
MPQGKQTPKTQLIPIMQLYPTFRYTDNFGEFGAVPEFRVNKPRLGNTHQTAALCVSAHLKHSELFIRSAWARLCKDIASSSKTINITINFIPFVNARVIYFQDLLVCKYKKSHDMTHAILTGACIPRLILENLIDF